MLDLDIIVPDVIQGEYNVISHRLMDFMDDSKTYNDAMSFLREMNPHLASIRGKIGKSDLAYLRISSMVVEAILQKIIPAINQEQSRVEAMHIRYEPVNYSLFRDLKEVANVSWALYRVMDKMDMEYQFKYERYLPSRRTLEQICSELSIDTRTSKTKIINNLEDSLDPDSGCLGMTIVTIIKMALVSVIFLVIVSVIRMCD